MKVKDLMSQNAKCLSIHDRVVDAKNLMDHYGFNSVPILDDEDRAKGVFTKEDLLNAPDEKIHLSQYCNNRLLSIEKEASLDAAVEIIKKNHVHHLIVNDEKGKVEGVLSTFDFLDLVKKL